MGYFDLNSIVWNPEPQVTDGLDASAPEMIFINCLQDTYLQYVTQSTIFTEGQRPTCDDLILTTDEGDISDITYSPGIGKSDQIRLQFYLYTNIRRHYATREWRLFDKADYSKMGEIMLMIDWTQKMTEVLTLKYYDTFTNENMEALPSINIKPLLISMFQPFQTQYTRGHNLKLHTQEAKAL